MPYLIYTSTLENKMNTFEEFKPIKDFINEYNTGLISTNSGSNKLSKLLPDEWANTIVEMFSNGTIDAPENEAYEKLLPYLYTGAVIPVFDKKCPFNYGLGVPPVVMYAAIRKKYYEFEIEI